LERVELEDESDDDFDYGEVSEGEFADDSSDDDEDLDAAMKTLTRKREIKATETAKPVGITDVKPTVVDDFIRNFLIKVGMRATLDTFNTEWYELKAKGKLPSEDALEVPDIYVRNQELDEQVKSMRKEVVRYEQIATKAQGTWDAFRKERDFHRMHHKRVMQEKNKLVQDLRRLQKHYDKFEPALAEMKRRYETAMKEKMLVKLERDRLAARVTSLEAEMRTMESGGKGGDGATTKRSKSRKVKPGQDTPFPSGEESNPFLSVSYEPVAVETYNLQKTFKGHHNAISAVTMHPTKPILATASDDMTWKMWSIPDGELVMSGDGHKDWLADVVFHPKGTHLATCSGDGMVKVWDFLRGKCTATFTDHTQVAWSLDFHHGGEFLASASMDHTAKLWDMNSQRCRQTFRGHVDSVNSVCFQPYSANLCTGSGDKTVSMWDVRSGKCVQTFYGHMNAVNGVAFNKRGDGFASCDADGVVKVWDIRMVTETASIQAGENPLNKLAFDNSGAILAASSDDGSVKLFSMESLSLLGSLKGHEDAVQDVTFDANCSCLVSCGSDNTFRVWGP
jgi:WD40 repeat protein